MGPDRTKVGRERRAGLPGQWRSHWGELPHSLSLRAAWSCGWTCSPWTCQPPGRLWTSLPASPRSELLGLSTSPPCPHPLPPLPWPRSPWSVGIVMPLWSCDRNRPTHQQSCGAALGRSPVLRQGPHPTVQSVSTCQHPPMGFHQNLGGTHVPTHTLSHTRRRKLPYLS